jgi:cardiolipin synthase
MPETDLAIRALAFAHLLAASGVTVHALLNKQDVRAAIGWIGLAWLSPVLGCIFYWLFGINRVSRLAASMNLSADRVAGEIGTRHATYTTTTIVSHLSALATLGERITGRPLTPGNKVQLLRSGDEAYPAMLAAIHSASRGVALASYLFRADASGRLFIDALAEARARGVEVRVLIDGVGGGYVFSLAARALRARGVTVARFLHDWIPWRMPLLNMRNHRKLLIVDGSVAFTGGLNIGAENVAATHHVEHVDDVHFRVEGPVVTQLMAAFAQDWKFTTGEDLQDAPWYPHIAPNGRAIARGISEGPDADLDKLEILLLAAIGEARSRIRIVTPYFLPDQRLLSALAIAALRGVSVQIAIPEHSNKPVVDWASRAQLLEIVDSGCKVFLMPAPFDHAKLMTVDGLWSLVGSANWDERSLRLNFEFNLEIYDGNVAGDIESLVDSKVTRGRPLSCDDLRSRAWPAKLRDAAARLLLPYL